MSGAGERARADIGFAGALEDFDPADWGPVPAQPPKSRVPAEAARRSAEATGFVSRQPGGAGAAAGILPPAPAAPPPRIVLPAPELAPERKLLRRRRTGRNTQFNLKARPETIEAYCAIADAHGWGLGETLEYAVALLRRDYGPPAPE